MFQMTMSIGRQNHISPNSTRHRNSRCHKRKISSVALQIPSNCATGVRTAGGDASRGPIGNAIPLLDQDIVTRAAIEHVLAIAALQDVIASAAEQGVVAVTSDEDVVAIASILGEADRPCREPRSLDRIIAG